MIILNTSTSNFSNLRHFLLRLKSYLFNSLFKYLRFDKENSAINYSSNILLNSDNSRIMNKNSDHVIIVYNNLISIESLSVIKINIRTSSRITLRILSLSNYRF